MNAQIATKVAVYYDLDQIKDDEEALEMCEQDTNYFVFDLKVLALHHAGKEKEALKLAEKVIEMTPDDKMPSSVSSLLLNK